MNFRDFQQNTSWTVNMNMQMSKLMMSSPHFCHMFCIYNFEEKNLIHACPQIKIYQLGQTSFSIHSEWI